MKEISINNCEIKIIHILMPISHERKCIFVHIPKCAGTSIEKHLGMFRNKKCLFGKRPTGNDFYQHMTMCELRAHVNETYFSFTFVRNPYTRLISDYKWCKRWFKHKWILPNETKVGFDTFSEYIHTIKKHIESTPVECIWSHFRPMYQFIYDGNELIVDYVGKIENMKNDFAFVMNVIKCDALPEKNLNSKIDTYYTRELLDIVNSLYLKDFEIFDYQMK